MKKIVIISMSICLFLSACVWAKNLPTVFTSFHQGATPTFTPISTITTSKNPQTEPSSTPASTPFPVHLQKKVVFNYYIIGDHSYYDPFIDTDSLRTYSKVVIFEDGQLIVNGDSYQQKILSSKEIEQFLSDLENLGFYSIETNHMHDPTDKLYDYGVNYQKSTDGRYYCIAIETDLEKNICAYEPDLQYLIPKMKSILQYLDNYEPEGMSPFIPDQLLVWIEEGRNPYDENLTDTPLRWGSHLPSLATSDYIIYVDNDIAKEIYSLFRNPNESMVFIENGKEYTLRINVVFPHEGVINPFQ